jgi:hypothetical protein
MKYLLIFLSFYSFSQNKLYFGSSASYLFNGKVQFIEGVVDIRDKVGTDFSIGFIEADNAGIELNYSGTYNCGLEFNGYSFSNFDDFSTSVNIHSISLNYIKFYKNNSPFIPFISIGSGASIFDVREIDAHDPVRFTLNAGGGTTIEINRFISARLRARFFAPLIFNGGGIYSGIGTGGASLGLSMDVSVPLAQLNVDAGLVFKLNWFE